jgi:hypothetical protein
VFSTGYKLPTAAVQTASGRRGQTWQVCTLSLLMLKSYFHCHLPFTRKLSGCLGLIWIYRITQGVQGFKVSVQHVTDTAGVDARLDLLQFHHNQALLGNAKPLEYCPVGLPDETILGGSSDTWDISEANLDPTIINSSPFGFRFRASISSGANVYVGVFCVRIKVFFHVPFFIPPEPGPWWRHHLLEG